MKKNLVLRTITGLLVVSAFIAAIAYSPYTFLAMFSILTFGILYEFYTLVNASKEVHIPRPLHALAGVLLFICTFCFCSCLTDHRIFLCYMVYIMAMFITLLYSRNKTPLRQLSYIIIGQIYIAAPIAFLNSVAFHTIRYGRDTIDDYCPIFLLALFFFIWIYDTGAYLFGITFGKHKLFPRISPKKSWEGVYGGIFFSMLLGLGLSYSWVWGMIGFDIHDGIRLSKLEWTLMAVIVSVFSTFGDLIESFVKRSVGVKDSGTILPGHGGLWDRFDSLLMATPALIIYLYIITLW